MLVRARILIISGKYLLIFQSMQAFAQTPSSNPQAFGSGMIITPNWTNTNGATLDLALKMTRLDVLGE